MDPNAIQPTSWSLWGMAGESLTRAHAACNTMVAARDRVTYETAWAIAVSSLEQFWTRFELEGKEKFSSFQPWAGAVNRFSEPLLKYLSEARHQDQHGRIPLEWQEPHLKIAPGFNGHLQSLRLFPDNTFEFDAIPAHVSQPVPTVEYSFGIPVLPILRNSKYKQNSQLFPPPKTFQGQSLAAHRPHEVVLLAIGFYESVLAQGMAKFGSNTLSNE